MQHYAITDRSLLPTHPYGWEAALTAQVDAWVRGGVEWVQLRERDLPEPLLLALMRQLARLARAPGSRTRLVVNGLQPRLAAESGAHGVHLRSGASEAEVRAAGRLCPHVSVSCHTLDEVGAARTGGASAALWAPVFGKVVGGAEVRAGTGLDELRAACELAKPLPVFALGGVTAVNAHSCVEAGAAGIAGIRLFHTEGWREL